jgi:hypothetical protein
MSDNEGNFKLFAATYLSFSATIFLPRTVLTLVKHSTGLHSKERFEGSKLQQTQPEKKILRTQNLTKFGKNVP